jgi:hypothetical protein
MIVQGIGHANHAESRPANTSKARASKPGVSKPVFPVSDKVELSGSAPERIDFIQQVKQKIKSGYYSSDTVMEDISHGFANILNQI